MKALWLREVEEVLASEPFQSWWQELAGLHRQHAEVSARYEELRTQSSLMSSQAEFIQKNAIDTLYQAGELEDEAAQLLADAAQIENKSFEAVAHFESQRSIVSDLYSRIGAVELGLESIRSELDALQNRADASEGEDQRREIDRQKRRKQEQLGEHSRRLQEMSNQYEAENTRKERIWEEVEQLWSRSLDINLGVSECRVRSRMARKSAEQYFRDAELAKAQAGQLARESEQIREQVDACLASIVKHKKSAGRSFDCLAGEDFLYWPCRENDKKVYCVPIKDHRDGYNIELKAGSIYLIDRQRGVEFVALLPPRNSAREKYDGRLDDFFAGPKGPTRGGS